MNRIEMLQALKNEGIDYLFDGISMNAKEFAIERANERHYHEILQDEFCLNPTAVTHMNNKPGLHIHPALHKVQTTVTRQLNKIAGHEKHAGRVLNAIEIAQIEALQSSWITDRDREAELARQKRVADRDAARRAKRCGA